MSGLLSAVFSLAVAAGAVVVLGAVHTTPTDLVAGIVALGAMLVFIRAIMRVAAEPDQRRRRADRGP